MSDHPKMLYRKGDMLPELGLDYCIVADAEEEEIALSVGWRVGVDPLDHDGDNKPGGSRRGRQRKA